ncbi:MAG: alanine--tRNA ligase [Elusimicrobia bacterium]|nr:alanine--tRNA ligase [Candidatus Liberimonas magnetica]
MLSSEIRTSFLQYFKDRGHTVIPSDSLIPSGDPTLLFTSAGMVQFKKHFLGQSKDTFTRASTCQKCFRTSDIDRVGYTNRHLTFFEMLGNFSFGDYFKKEAIDWGWEFLTKEMGLSENKLYATIYKNDDEAYNLWKKIVPDSKIIRLSEESNFWNMGPTGPCGPCSEILIDLGEKLKCSKPGCGPGCDCDRYLEIWNLVFTQFDRQENGELKNLPRKNIDTGMGLERLVTAVNGKESSFETDLFEPIVKNIADILEIKMTDHTSKLRMMADHARGVTFLASDGILPSNEGRGYVLRRLLRRALRQGKMLGITEPFLYKITAEIAQQMKSAYPELEQRRENIASIIKMEEENFLSTLETGTQMLNEIIDKYSSTDIVKGKEALKSKFVIPGDEVFKLYDTYGFPMELTKEIAKEKGIDIDEEGFLSSQKKAQEKSRSAWSGSGQKDITLYSKLQKELGESKFCGYEKTLCKSKVVAIIKDGNKVDSISENEQAEVVLDNTPFYAESGGQVGDTGSFKTGSLSVEVVNTVKPIEGLIVHHVKVLKGELKTGQVIDAIVEFERRKKIRAHHTATHLLHKALRQILGTHVTQAGSLVTPDNFRFDFTHFQALKENELQAVEDIVNKAIRDNMEVCISSMKIDEARKQGAMALFSEKYGANVRAVSVIEPENQTPFSMELCGGTHTERTGDIGFFKILSESSIASGTRRIEGVAGSLAEKYIRKLEDSLNSAAFKLKCDIFNVPEKIDKVLLLQKESEKEIKKLKSQSFQGTAGDPLKDVKEVNGVKLLISKLSGMDIDTLRTIADKMRSKLGSGIVILVNSSPEKVSFIVSVTPDLMNSGYNAGKIAKAFASLIEGSGGGKPEFAQGGGKDASKIDFAISKLPDILK